MSPAWWIPSHSFHVQSLQRCDLMFYLFFCFVFQNVCHLHNEVQMTSHSSAQWHSGTCFADESLLHLLLPPNLSHLPHADPSPCPLLFWRIVLNLNFLKIRKDLICEPNTKSMTSRWCSSNMWGQHWKNPSACHCQSLCPNVFWLGHSFGCFFYDRWWVLNRKLTRFSPEM